MTDETIPGLSPAEVATLRSLLTRTESAPAPSPVPVASQRVESLADVKENLQAAGDQLIKGWDRLRIPVRVYQRETTGERRSGYYPEQKSFDDFVEFVHEYFVRYPNSEAHQYITALINAIVFFRGEQQRVSDNVFLLIDQYALLQERMVQQAIADETRALRDEYRDQVKRQVLPPPPAPRSVTRALSHEDESGGAPEDLQEVQMRMSSTEEPPEQVASDPSNDNDAPIAAPRAPSRAGRPKPEPLGDDDLHV